jgi:hypothetical protein
LPAEKIFMFWGLLVLLVPLTGSRLKKEWTRADQWFAATCVLVTFVLLAFVPRPALDMVEAAAATIAASAVIVGAYLAFVPPAKPHALRLAILVGVMDVAALAAIYLGDMLNLGWPLSSLVLLAFAATPIVLARPR